MKTWLRKAAVASGVIATLISSGCVYVVVGGVGALGGYMVSPDTFEGLITDVTEKEVYEATKEVLGLIGVIQEEDPNSGILIAKVQGAKITATVSPYAPDVVKLSIKARKALLPRVRLAQDIFVRVNNLLLSRNSTQMSY